MRKALASALALACAFLGLLALVPTAANAVNLPAGRLVSEVAANGTPHVLNGRVYSIEQVGNTVVLGGTFTSARNDGSDTALDRSRLLAFNAETGQISTTFLPQPNGAVNVVIPAGDGESVYVGGSFGRIGGLARRNLARVRVSDGAVMANFKAGSINGPVKDLRLSDGRLWVAGGFTRIGTSNQAALATVDTTTGASDTFMSGVVAGLHNGGITQVAKMDINPSGTRLVAIGNFDILNGVKNHQMFMLDLTGASATQANFQTAFYQSACSGSFDSYMRDLDFSPDGTFFVVSTTGAYGGSTSACDTTARWDISSTGNGVQPSWVNYTGGDTTYAVEVTGSAVYVGGHFRWQNNAFSADRAGQGAISREGIAALDPINGLPFSWNPGRTKGVGVFDFLVTPQGLWVGSDTDRIGNLLKSRIALMPTAGKQMPAIATPGLPNDIFVAAGTTQPTGLLRRSFNNGVVTGATTPPTGGSNWSSVRGAFMVNGWLYTAWSDGTFTRRTFNGTTYGASVPVNTADLITPLTDWRGDIQQATGMFYDSGRIYFTRSGSNQLFYRYFTPESDVVGAKRFVASNNVTGIDFAQVRGMFNTGSQLFWATSTGDLRQMSWVTGALAGAPVAGTASVVSGPSLGGPSWSSRSLFLNQDANGNGVGLPPTAAFTSDCTSRTCTFDASASSALGGQITGYAWDFGGGNGGNGVNPSHTFATDGPHSVSLTVTSNSGGTASLSQTVTVQRVNEAPVASFTASCAVLVCDFDAGGSTDDMSIASYAWDFGDGETGSGLTTSHTYADAAPRTVTLAVTDGDNAQGSTASEVNPSPVEADVAYVGANSSNGNRSNHTVSLPAGVATGDTLVLFMTSNSISNTVVTPAGWSVLQSEDGSNFRARVWTRTATADDIGSSVTVSTSGFEKSDLTVAAYRGSGGSSVGASDGLLVNGSNFTHTTPSVNVAGSGAWLVSYWAEKSTGAISWTPPAGQSLRSGSDGSGGGKVSAILADSGGPVAAGTRGALVAATDVATTRVAMFSVVIEVG